MKSPPVDPGRDGPMPDMEENESKRWPSSIRNTLLRRALCGCIAFPLVFVWHGGLMMVLGAFWRAIIEAGLAFTEELHDSWTDRDARLLRLGFWAMWSDKWPTDEATAIAEARQRVGGRP